MTSNRQPEKFKILKNKQDRITAVKALFEIVNKFVGYA